MVASNIKMFCPELRVLLQTVPLALNDECVSMNTYSGWGLTLKACDLDLLLRLANHHGMMLWLAKSLESSELDADDSLADFARRVNKIIKIHHFQSEQQTRIAIDISNNLNEEKVRHAFFKGVALQHQFYPEGFNLRVSDDADILIDPSSLELAVAVLERMHYSYDAELDVRRLANFIAKTPSRYRGRDISLKKTSGFDHAVDMHWKVADDFSFSAKTENLLKRTVPIATKHGVLQGLSFHEHFVYVCTHGYLDYFFRLRYLIDVHIAMRHSAFNLEEALVVAKKFGVTRHVEESIRLSNRFFSNQEGAKELSQYEQIITQRLRSTKGITNRIHPNTGQWTRKDKNQHLCRQIKNRSVHSYWFSPILSRMKITQEAFLLKRPSGSMYARSLYRSAVRLLRG